MTSRHAGSDRDERDWVERLRAGDAAACEAIYLAYHDKLWEFAYRYVRSEAVAEELVQDVFMALWERRAALEVHAGLGPYLFGSVRNRALRARAREATERDVLATSSWGGAEGSLTGPPPKQIDEAVADDAFDAAVERIIRRLPERSAQILFLRWKHGMSYSEVAAVLGISPAAAQKQARRTIEKLRPFFEVLREDIELGEE